MRILRIISNIATYETFLPSLRADQTKLSDQGLLKDGLVEDVTLTLGKAGRVEEVRTALRAGVPPGQSLVELTVVLQLQVRVQGLEPGQGGEVHCLIVLLAGEVAPVGRHEASEGVAHDIESS